MVRAGTHDVRAGSDDWSGGGARPGPPPGPRTAKARLCLYSKQSYDLPLQQQNLEPNDFLDYPNVSGLCLAQASVALLRPAFAANAVSTPENVVRVVSSLHFKQAAVIRSKEGSAPIRLVRVALYATQPRVVRLDWLTSLK